METSNTTNLPYLQTPFNATLRMLVTRIVNFYDPESTGNRRPVYLLGNPGEGKSDVVRKAARAASDILRQRGLIKASCDFLVNNREHGARVNLYSPEEMRGFPIVGKDSVKWDTPDWWNDVNEKILLLEEIASAPELVQTGAYQLTQDFGIGPHQLDDDVFVIGTGNLPGPNTGARPIPHPLRTRFQTIVVKQTASEWLEYMGEKLDPVIAAFIQFKGDDGLSNFDPKSQEVAHANPRTWEDMNANYRMFEERDRLAYAAGTIGLSMAKTFHAFAVMAERETLVDPDEALANPDTCMLPASQEAAYFMLGGLLSRVHKGNWPAYCAYTKRMVSDIGIAAVVLAVNRMPELRETTEYSEYIVECDPTRRSM